MKAWRKVSDAEVAAILAGVERYKLTDGWKRDGGQYIPHPAKFLNGRRWEDDLPSPVLDGTPKLSSPCASAEVGDTEPVQIACSGGPIVVDVPKSTRLLLTERERNAMAGSNAFDWISFFARRGWKARLLTAEEVHT
jgi:hypothetical protein